MVETRTILAARETTMTTTTEAKGIRSEKKRSSTPNRSR